MALLLLLVAVMAGCVRAPEQGQRAATGRDSPFREGDLARVLPRPAEEPPGTSFAQAVRGRSVFRRLLNESTSMQLKQLGVSGRFAAGLERTFESPDGEVLETGALLFENRSAALRFFQVAAIDYTALDRVEGGIERARLVRRFDLGDEAFGVKGSLVAHSPRESVVLLVWRQRNLVLYVRAFGVTGMPGSADIDLAREVAEMVDSKLSSM